MERRRLWRRVRAIWVSLGLSLTVIFVAWSLLAYRASPEARSALRSDERVVVRHEGNVWSFVPGAGALGTASLVFFPGALVDPAAYAPLLRAVAEAGHAAFMVELPRRGAFGGADAPEVRARLDRLLRARQSRAPWIIAGHSRGGVVASAFAGERPAGLTGVVLIGTSHPRDVDLSALAIQVTKIVGTRDGLASRSEVEANRALVPATTRWVWIDGGNHSQFGWYGFQPGDRRASIPPAAQRSQMIAAVLDALRNAPLSPHEH